MTHKIGCFGNRYKLLSLYPHAIKTGSSKLFTAAAGNYTVHWAQDNGFGRIQPLPGLKYTQKYVWISRV